MVEVIASFLAFLIGALATAFVVDVTLAVVFKVDYPYWHIVLLLIALRILRVFLFGSVRAKEVDEG